MTEDYTNMDLDTADEILVAAGHPSIAKALRFQTQGNRNMIQGEWGQSFVNALDTIMEKRIVTQLTNVQISLDRILGSVIAADKTAQQALTVAKAGAARLGKLSTEVKVVKKALDESKRDRADLRREIAELKAWRDAQDGARYE